MKEPSLADATHEAIDRLQRIEGALGRLPVGTEQGPPVGDLTALRETLGSLEGPAGGRAPVGAEQGPLVGAPPALRETLERLEGLERDARHRLGHDLRVPLNTLAGGGHLLGVRPATPRTGR